MATATKKRSSKPSKTRKLRYIGNPAGVIQQPVEAVGPTRFAIISVDCAKRRSKWMLCDFYGQVLIEPTDVEHQTGAFATIKQ